jgi:tRNA threonylcarbamoyladenosine biosynthesis protein TsaB
MKILALSTSGPVASVCLSYSEPCYQSPGPQAATQIFSLIDRCLAGQALRSIDLIAFDAGPGGFTGVRVGCGVAQGLGFGLGIPVIAVNSLEALAFNAKAKSDQGDTLVLVAIDARMGEVYFAAYLNSSRGLLLCLIEPSVANADIARQAFARLLAVHKHEAFCLGGAFDTDGVHSALAQWAAEVVNAKALGQLFVDAKDVVRLAQQTCLAMHIDDLKARFPAASAAPMYIRNNVALNKAEQAQLRAGRT